MNRLQIPTGPIMSFQAIPFPLGKQQQDGLRHRAERIAAARAALEKSSVGSEDREIRQAVLKQAEKSLAEYESDLRLVLGVELVRRTFLPVGIGASRA